MSTLNRPVEESRELTRRNFTLDAALALLAGCVITISDACGSSSTTTPSRPPADVTGVISANHGHVAVGSTAQMTAGAALSLSSAPARASVRHRIVFKVAGRGSLN